MRNNSLLFLCFGRLCLIKVAIKHISSPTGQLPSAKSRRYCRESLLLYIGFPNNFLAGSLEEAAERTRDVLSESVRLRLRSDVEVGTYLSGGLDSSITTLLATQHSPYPVRTFSISFEEAVFDESEIQDEVSRYLGTQHTALSVSNGAIAETFPNAFGTLKCQFSEPLLCRCICFRKR